MKLQEYFTWQIVLKDGTIIDQSKSGEEETFKFNDANKNFKNIKKFILIPQDRNLNKITMELPEDSRLIYFRRTIANTGNMFPKFQINMIGWQKTVGKVNVKVIMYVFPDGTTEIREDDEPLYTQTFIAALPQISADEVKSCTGCKPRLEKAKE